MEILQRWQGMVGEGGTKEKDHSLALYLGSVVQNQLLFHREAYGSDCRTGHFGAKKEEVRRHEINREIDSHDIRNQRKGTARGAADRCPFQEKPEVTRQMLLRSLLSGKKY